MVIIPEAIANQAMALHYLYILYVINHCESISGDNWSNM